MPATAPKVRDAAMLADPLYSTWCRYDTDINVPGMHYRPRTVSVLFLNFARRSPRDVNPRRNRIANDAGSTPMAEMAHQTHTRSGMREHENHKDTEVMYEAQMAALLLRKYLCCPLKCLGRIVTGTTYVR